ncbi:Stearoyl-CoA desaturase [Trichinella spiralis]|uniref:Stearoyl-CoA desaturase n=1 Tax=Trichinella spiralis TaxID=6334 RepID=A0ABR3K2E2_TRISP
MLIRPTKFICCFLLFDWLINFETAVLYSVPTLIIIFHHWLSFDKLLSLSRLAAAAHASRPDSSLKARLSSKIIDIAEQQFVAFQATVNSVLYDEQQQHHQHTEADEKQRSEEIIITSQPLATTTPNSCLYDSSRSFQSQDVEQHLRVNRHSDQLENSTST